MATVEATGPEEEEEAEEEAGLYQCPICRYNYTTPDRPPARRQAQIDTPSIVVEDEDRHPIILTCCGNSICWACFEKHRASKAAELPGNRKRIKCMMCNEPYHREKDTPYVRNKHAESFLSRKRVQADEGVRQAGRDDSDVGAARRFIRAANEKKSAAQAMKEAAEASNAAAATALEKAQADRESAQRALDAAKQSLDTATVALQAATAAASESKSKLDQASAEFSAATASAEKLKETLGSLMQLETERETNSQPPTTSDEGVEQCSQIKKFRGHSESVWALAAFGTDQFLSGSSGCTVKLWNIGSGECVRTFQGHSSTIRDLATFGDDAFLSGSSDRTIRLWSVSTGNCIRTFEGHSGKVSSLAVSGEDTFVSGSHDKTIKLWNASSGRLVRTFKGHSSWVTSVSFVGDVRFISGSDDNTIKLWDMTTGTVLRTFRGHSDYDYVRSVAAVGNNAFLSGSRDKTVKLWNIASGECIRTFNPGCRHGVDEIVPLGETKFLCRPYRHPLEKNACLYDMASGDRIHTFQTDSAVYSLALVGSSRLVTGHSDGHVAMWKL